MPPSPPNTVDRLGYWGNQTSTLDWCEYNYEVSIYIAEFWNTLSNLFMIVPPLWAIYLGIRQQIGTRLLLCYLSLLVVGIGSWLFHMTLLYEMQLMDELPMVWGTLASSYTLYDIDADESKVNVKLALGLVLYGTIISVVYVTINIPEFHQAAYGLLVAVSFLYSFNLARKKYFPMRWFLLSICMYAVGFAVWNIDNVFCSNLRTVRSGLPGFFAPLTQLHAWWHFFAGYGSYISILYLSQARLKALKRHGHVKVGCIGLYVDVGREKVATE
ncbi:alkaline ceramidase 3 [Galendromus occidentalis]|uniref:Alkaline ceramidase n=1 Tax=Galendromus occidentalis TaxID=34638 RepID=A0AAJ6QW03_9ACAR|nr:alkaline ceramidase 3 [Galendromus occidentalis]